ATGVLDITSTRVRRGDLHGFGDNVLGHVLLISHVADSARSDFNDDACRSLLSMLLSVNSPAEFCNHCKSLDRFAGFVRHALLVDELNESMPFFLPMCGDWFFFLCR